jgi:hypothetical protein
MVAGHRAVSKPAGGAKVKAVRRAPPLGYPAAPYLGEAIIETALGGG